MPLPDREGASSFANAQDIAYAAIRNWILGGPLKPGEVIRDVEVAKLLGISRTPVREALIRLAHEGLIDIGKGRKTRISIPDARRAPDLYGIGGMLDALAAERAAPKLGKADMERLRALNAEMDRQEDPVRLAALDIEFHSVFRGFAGEVVKDLLDGIEAEIARLERMAFDDAEIRTQTRRDHQDIVTAFATGDPAAAAAAVKRNWLNAWARLEARLGQHAAPAGPRRS